MPASRSLASLVLVGLLAACARQASTPESKPMTTASQTSAPADRPVTARTRVATFALG